MASIKRRNGNSSNDSSIKFLPLLNQSNRALEHKNHILRSIPKNRKKCVRFDNFLLNKFPRNIYYN